METIPVVCNAFERGMIKPVFKEMSVAATAINSTKSVDNLTKDEISIKITE
ncbi:hypothetical protein M9991_08140 [Chryseobacterium gallinarum]|uniref:hypothetical protein n=1 Tax=Chryseobacterium gallinarum TaxID=1324352 RepID=UPI002024EBCF|nr:hypothetical protein [Chryseobacterium gallinarum]MCL8536839.1 hypothetical protein [Chryseobacterium gallinarum]